MVSTQQSDRVTYRAIVLGQGGGELLLARAGDGFLLPSVEVPRWQRLAENLTAAIEKDWGQEAICLFNPDVSATLLPATPHNYQVMECREPAKSHSRAEWVQVSLLSKQAFADPLDQVAVRQSLAECDKHAGGTAPGPFVRLGWFRELQGWVEDVIGGLGLYLSGRFCQLNASPSFSLIRFETSGRAVWFKAVGDPNLREFPITLELAGLFPQYVPPILSTRPEWNGWLALEARGTNLDETQDVQYWNTAASALAQLQIESIGKTKTLLDSGARDLRAPTLLKLLRPFLDVMSQLMEEQTKIPPPVLAKRDLEFLGEQTEEALVLTAGLGIPDALGHLDLNPGNIIVSDRECVFLDWAEGYVGNPLFSLQYLAENFRRNAGANETAESQLGNAYTKNWQASAASESLEDALGFAPILAVFAYAAGSDAWSDEARLRDPKSAGYLRSLTRRMDREAKRLRDRRVLCPN